MTDEVEALVDPLFDLPLATFVGERNLLAKTVGDKDAAARIRAVTKPSVAAWVVNQLVRRTPGALDALVAAGDALRDAQRAAVGGDTSSLASAQTGERDAIRALGEPIATLLDEAGVTGPAHRGRVTDLLEAIAADPAVRGQALAGRLRADHRRTGFGDFLEAPVRATPTPEQIRADRDRGALAAKLARARERVERLTREAREAQDRADTARAVADQAVVEAEQIRAAHDALG